MGFKFEEVLRPFKNIREMIEDLYHHRYLSAANNYLESVPGMLTINTLLAPSIKLGAKLLVKHVAVNPVTVSKVATGMIKFGEGVINWYLKPAAALAQKSIVNPAVRVGKKVAQAAVREGSFAPAIGYSILLTLGTAAAISQGRQISQAMDKSRLAISKPNSSRVEKFSSATKDAFAQLRQMRHSKTQHVVSKVKGKPETKRAIIQDAAQSMHEMQVDTISNWKKEKHGPQGSGRSR